MTRLVIATILAALLSLAVAPRAEARIFEPPRDWWHSGATCIESRSPAGLDWDGSPPRACVEPRQSRAEYATAKREVGPLRFSERKAPTKRSPNKTRCA